MQMPDSDDDFHLYHLTGVRTCGIRDNPNHVVLEITAPGKEWHFVLRLDDLAALGRRMTQDAMLMKG